MLLTEGSIPGMPAIKMNRSRKIKGIIAGCFRAYLESTMSQCNFLFSGQLNSMFLMRARSLRTSLWSGQVKFRAILGMVESPFVDRYY